MAKGKYAEWLKDENIILMQGWARNGLTDEQIAHNIGINVKTLYDWKNKYSKISNALKESKEIADLAVENALYKKAVGHKVTLKKPIKVKKEKNKPGVGKIIEETIEYCEEEVYIPPDTTAQIFWLKNRKKADWRDKPVAEAVDVMSDDGLLAALAGLEDEMMDDDDFLPDDDAAESEGN